MPKRLHPIFYIASIITFILSIVLLLYLLIDTSENFEVPGTRIDFQDQATIALPNNGLYTLYTEAPNFADDVDATEEAFSALDLSIMVSDTGEQVPLKEPRTNEVYTVDGVRGTPQYLIIMSEPSDITLSGNHLDQHVSLNIVEGSSARSMVTVFIVSTLASGVVMVVSVLLLITAIIMHILYQSKRKKYLSTINPE